MKRNLIGFFVVSSMTIAVAMIASCAKKSSNADGTANATLSFRNANSNGPVGFLNLLDHLIFPNVFATVTTSSPTVFKMKLIAAYLTEDIDSVTYNNIGQTSMFYLNPDCQDDISHCDISGGTAEDGQPMSKIVTQYFDFGKTTDEVNAELNAQSRSIAATSYKYVRLEFCKYNHENSSNIIWAGGNVDAGSPKSFQRNSCVVNSAQMNPPLQVSDGDSVTVQIEYDYSDSISIGADVGSNTDDCNGDQGTNTRTCFRLPTFVPSASM